MIEIKRLLMILAGGLIFLFGVLGIIDLATDKLDHDITETTLENTQVEDFNTEL